MAADTNACRLVTGRTSKTLEVDPQEILDRCFEAAQGSTPLEVTRETLHRDV